MTTSKKLDEIFSKIDRDKREYLVSPFLRRINGWMEKANSTRDAFDKYVATFIAFNMFYNLWHKIKNPTAKEKQPQEGIKLMGVLELVNFEDPPNLTHLVDDLIKILEEDQLFVEIYEWKNKKLEFTGLAQDVLTKHRGQNDKLMKYILKTLYKIRCNLVHGEKGYEDRQIRLLNKSSEILKVKLLYLINQINLRLNKETITKKEVIHL